MKTDQAIYQFLATGPEAFRVITGGMVLPGPYQFSAPAIKSLERRIDALFKPVGHHGPVYIIEFQAQPSPKAWYNLLAKMSLYGEEHSQQQIQGILIFPSRAQDTTESNWISQAAPSLVSAVYLEEFLPHLLVTEPDNPFVAVFAPFILSSDAEVMQQAPQLWRTVHAATEPIRANLERILEAWLFERFKHLPAKEVLAMFQPLVPLEETRAYQEIFAQGLAKGLAKGEINGIAKGKDEGKIEGEAKGKATLLKRQILRRFGKLPKWAQTRIDKADTMQLDTWAEAIFDAKDLKQLLGKASDV